MKYTFEEAKKDHQAIKLINRVFHDIDSEYYDIEHPEIVDSVRENCVTLFNGYIKDPAMRDDFTLLDVGTGTGFFIANIAHLLRPGNTVIFSDISEKMIGIVRNKFSSFGFKQQFLVTDAEKYELPEKSVDVVMVHSVLHHLPAYRSFLKEADRLLKDGGLIIITHEPNRSFSRNPILTLFVKAYSKMNALLLKRNRTGASTRVDSNVYSRLVADLKSEGLEFSEPLTMNQFNSLIDIESPTASGEYDAAKGFDAESIAKENFPGYEVLKIRTYAALGKINEEENAVTRIFAALFRSLFPSAGYHFELILRKK